MTAEQALYQFYSRFGIPAYEENSVPSGDDKPAYPYITYEVADTRFGVEIPLSMTVWDRSDSLVRLATLAARIEDELTRGGIFISWDTGALWLKPADPLTRNAGDDSDNLVHRKIFNLSAEFIV